MGWFWMIWIWIAGHWRDPRTRCWHRWSDAGPHWCQRPHGHKHTHRDWHGYMPS